MLHPSRGRDSSPTFMPLGTSLWPQVAGLAIHKRLFLSTPESTLLLFFIMLKMFCFSFFFFHNCLSHICHCSGSDGHTTWLAAYGVFICLILWCRGREVSGHFSWLSGCLPLLTLSCKMVGGPLGSTLHF